MQYLRIAFSGLKNDQPTWPAPPSVVYVEYVWNAGGWTVAQMDVSGGVYNVSLSNWTPPFGSLVRMIYSGYKGTGTSYGYLDANNSAFYAAYLAGNLSGVYTGNYGETWTITHHGYDGTILFPSGEGGEPGLIFTEQTPYEQVGGDPPAAASTPNPPDDDTGVRLVLPQATWV